MLFSCQTLWHCGDIGEFIELWHGKTHILCSFCAAQGFIPMAPEMVARFIGPKGHICRMLSRDLGVEERIGFVEDFWRMVTKWQQNIPKTRVNLFQRSKQTWANTKKHLHRRFSWANTGISIEPNWYIYIYTLMDQMIENMEILSHCHSLKFTRLALRSVWRMPLRRLRSPVSLESWKGLENRYKNIWSTWWRNRDFNLYVKFFMEAKSKMWSMPL